jgi:hypothetical protein
MRADHGAPSSATTATNEGQPKMPIDAPFTNQQPVRTAASAVRFPVQPPPQLLQLLQSLAQSSPLMTPLGNGASVSGSTRLKCKASERLGARF